MTIDADGDATGDYSLHLIDAAAAPLIALGETVSAVLDPAVSSLAYRFTGNAGERIYVDRTAHSGGDTYWRLIDPAGRQVLGPQSINSDFDVTTLALNGTYTLLVEGRYYQVGGTASFSFKLNAVSDDSPVLALGALANGRIAHPGQRDTYSFTLDSAHRVVLDGQVNSNALRWSLAGPSVARRAGAAVGAADSGAGTDPLATV